jgi:hypothetical protein
MIGYAMTQRAWAFCHREESRRLSAGRQERDNEAIRSKGLFRYLRETSSQNLRLDLKHVKLPAPGGAGSFIVRQRLEPSHALQVT